MPRVALCTFQVSPIEVGSRQPVEPSGQSESLHVCQRRAALENLRFTLVSFSQSIVSDGEWSTLKSSFDLMWNNGLASWELVLHRRCLYRDQ